MSISSPFVTEAPQRAAISDPARDRRHFRWIFLALAVALIVLPAFVYPIFLMKLLCFALFAIAFNLLLGHCGLLSFGHAAFFGAGGYVAAYAALVWRLPPEAAVALGTMTGVVLGAVFGALAIRRQGIYLTMVTLGLAQLIYFVALRSPFTGAEDGIQNVPRGTLFGMIDLKNDVSLYFVIATVFLVTLLLTYRLAFSPFGQVLRAIRGNEPRAISLGLNVRFYKLAVFIISAGLSGLAGSMKAVVFQIASLVDVHISTSGEVVLMTLVGGVGTILGPIVGAAVIVVSQNYLAGFGEWVVFLQGLIFVISVLLFRDGIVGVISRKIGRPL
ncbi:branched-chain amino acid ABC transporter permease [Phreatobacter stygius]|uniref:Branched-chain amino acid ABC transporter permease n=1 Tax=Phreatobacter stygius TaxID=1940610 RepID=A0A4D7B0V0_9HYPH|nr:branched-chain amino acid ABC transporter permease [Phreatobacter stygius]QCI64408.1 branched-chain amino acid ABC transporter permease [Phreatobacter stygius]